MARESWGSRFGFLMATAGFAIGLGNLWRFPYLTGMNGGGAFLVIYLVLAVFIGIPLFTAEISLGRKTQLTPIAGMRKLTGTWKSPWNLVGWLGVLAVFMIETYYGVVMAWVLVYFFKTSTGQFVGASPPEVEAAYATLVADPLLVLLCMAAVFFLVGLIVTRGLRAGVERVAKWLMPVLFVFLIVLAIRSLSFPGAMAGLRWYLAPDWSEVNASVVLAALGQVFFSIGVGMAAAFAYGGYLHPTKSDVPGNAVIVVGFDTLAAFTAGLVMFPALFAFGLQPDVGPGLLFVTMTNVFARAPAGALIGGLFFLLVFVAGITSVFAVMEALTATVMDSLGLGRKQALWGLIGLVFIAGVPSALSFGPWSEVRLFGLNIFGLVDFVSGNVVLTLSGLMLALYIAFAWGFERFQRETNVGAHGVKVFTSWKPLIKYVIPAAVALVLISSLGLFA